MVQDATKPIAERDLEDFVAGQAFSSGPARILRRKFIPSREIRSSALYLNESAAKSFFRGLAASGWHTAASPCDFWWRATLSLQAE